MRESCEKYSPETINKPSAVWGSERERHAHLQQINVIYYDVILEYKEYQVLSFKNFNTVKLIDLFHQNIPYENIYYINKCFININLLLKISTSTKASQT